MKLKKSLRILIIILLPIVLGILIYLIFFADKGGKTGASEFSDSFNDTSYIDLANSSNYSVSSGQVSASGSTLSYGDGSDGSITISANTNINTTNSISGRSCADGGDAVNYSVTALTSNTATLSASPSAGCLVAGDAILLINLSGTSTSVVNVGNYEILEIQSVSSNVVTFTANKVNYYGDGASNDTNLGTTTTTQRVILQRVPQYDDVTVNAGVAFYPSDWDKIKGGIMFFEASGTVTVNGSIIADGAGYSGGLGATSYYSPYGYADAGEGAFYTNADDGRGGDGYDDFSGWAGLFSGGGGGGHEVGSTGTAGAGGIGSVLDGAIGGGGGGTSYRTSSSTSSRGGGGGGGGHATVGTGGYGCAKASDGTSDSSGAGSPGAYCDSTRNEGGGGGGGSVFGDTLLDKLTLGGGGGGGGWGRHPTDGTLQGRGGKGGSGGGVVYIIVDSLVVNSGGSITSKGDAGGDSLCNGGTVVCTYGGGGGGGAGGSIKIVGNSVSLGSNLVNSSGGLGNTNTTLYGGNGGSGYVAIEYVSSLSGSTTPTATVTQVSAYADTATIQSIDLISEEYDVEIMSFVYNLSSKPSGTGATVQFSTDGANWYNSSGVLGATDSLGTGTDNTIDLSGLGWQTQSFFYKIVFDTNGGSDTPILDDVTVGYNANPVTPTIGTPEALSTTSIRWNFTDNAGNENGFKLYDDGDSLILTENTQNLSYIDETDLSPNTQYTRKVVAFNDLGNSEASSSASIYTLAEEPTLTIGDLNITSVSLEAGNTNNITSGSSGLFFDCTGDTCDTGINEWVQTTEDTVTGLSANTQYSFKVKARNGDGVETLNSSNVLIYTLADIPTLTISEVGTTSVSLSAGNTSNISEDSSGIFFDCTGDSCDTGINDWTQNSYDIVEDLMENTQYTFHVKARNGDGVETAYSSTESVYTLLNTPSILSGSVGSTQIEITASSVPNRGAGSTGLYFDCVSEGCDTGINEWVDSSTVVSSDLDNNEMYEYRVKGRNADGIETGYSDTETFYTLAAVPVLSVSSVTTGSVSLSAEGVNNLSVGSSGLFFDCTGDNCDTGINEWIRGTMDTATGLSANTQYTFVSKARSRNSIETSNSNMVSVYTLANIPGAPVEISKGTNNVVLKISTNSNPSSTEYLVQEVSTGKYLNPSTNSLESSPSWNTYTELGGSDGINIEGLEPGKTYTFKVKAVNGDDIETDFGNTLSVTTSLVGPTMNASETLSTSSIKWKFTDHDSNETGFKIVDSHGNDVVTCSGADLSSCTETGLSAGTGYSRMAYSYNGQSESAFSNLVSGYTFANIPGQPAVEALNSHSVNLKIDTNGNGSSTQYLIQEDQTKKIVNITTGELTSSESWGSYLSWNGSSGIDILNLDPNEKYIFKVRAKNGNGDLTEYSSKVEIITPANIPTNIKSTELSSTSIKVTFSANSNPSNTEYAVQDSLSGMFINPITNRLVSSTTWATYSVFGGTEGIIVEGLKSGEEYNFRVKARNSSGVETNYADGDSVLTYLSGPSINTPEALSTTSIRWKFTDRDSVETGFKIFDTSGTEKVTCVGINLSSCTENKLLPGSSYSRKIYSYNSNGLSPYSNIILGYTLSNTPGVPTVSSTDTNSANIRIDINGNGNSTQYAIRETQSNLYVNISDGTLTTNPSWGTYVEWGSSLGKDIAGLTPNRRYSFAVIARNGMGVNTEYSSAGTVTTLANLPSNVQNSEISVSSIKVTFGSNSNPSDTEYVIQDEISGMFVNPVTRNLVSSEVWGTYSVFGGTDGITVGGLDPSKAYSFRVKARNADGAETSYSPGSGSAVIGARILNVPSGLKVVLSSNQDISVDTDEGRQSGTKNVRVKASEYIVADIPVSFVADRDWSNVVLSMNAAEYKTVIKVSKDEGLADKFIMYVVSGDTDSFRLCPEAKSLENTGSGCEGEVLFTGEFPLTKEVEGTEVTVSKAQLDGVMYWIVDGLSGTGGQGFVAGEEENTDTDTDTDEESSIVNIVTTKVLGDLGKNIKTVTKKATEAIDDTIVGDLEEGELQTVAATTSVVTVTVGASIAVGGFSEFLYIAMQAINGFFNWLGFRRKKIQYGYVYNSYTKEPISGVVVRIYEVGGGLVDTFVTDKRGIFFGNIKPGIYNAKIKKKGYVFPSELIKGKNDLPMKNIYHGDDFILSEDEFVKLAIPLDPVSLAKEKRKRIKAVNILGNIFSILNIFLFAGGVGLSIYMYMKYPKIENMLVGLIYIPALYALIVSFFGVSKRYGVVRDTKGTRMGNVEVVVKETEFDQSVAKRITDEKGRYRFVLPAGKYRIEVFQKGYMVEKIYKGAYVEGKKEVVVSRNIVLKKK